MSIFKLLVIIVAVWFILKIRRFISGTQITSGKSSIHDKKNNWKIDKDIQDADYEDVE